MLIQHFWRVYNFCTDHISHYFSFHCKYTSLQYWCVVATYALNCKYCNSSRWQEALELLLLWYRCLTIQPYGSTKAAFSEITKTTLDMQPCKFDWNVPIAMIEKHTLYITYRIYEILKFCM